MTQQTIPAEIAALVTRCREDNAGNLAYLRQHLGARPLLIGWLHKNAGASARLAPLIAEAIAKHAIGDFDPDNLPTKAGAHPVQVENHGTYEPPKAGDDGADTKPQSAWDRLSERTTERRM